MSYTPGPWIADGKLVHAENGSALYIAECQNVGVGERWSGTDYASEPHAEANARLIAAAPELLEVLESIEMRLDAFNEAQRDMPADSVWVCLEKARAAIAKAKGETA